MEPKKDIDQLILETLAGGYEQKEIHDHFKKMGITPNSVSLIKKRIKAMKAEYRAKTLFQLALIVKRKGLI
jgi:hypothetical protein